MKIQEYIEGYFAQRLAQDECLVVYDPDQRYHAAVQTLASETCTVIDASTGTIENRERTTEAWLNLIQGNSKQHSLLVYLPIDVPHSERAWQQDPYAPFALAGGYFPCADHERYDQLAEQAKPRHADQVRALFADGYAPSFETLDALDAGSTWPQLRSLLRVESAREICVALLAPSDEQKAALKGDGAWVSEYKSFANAELGLQVAASVADWQDAQVELARYLLFSEFALDLPDGLPGALQDVPRSGAERQALIFGICEDLRTSERTQETYRSLASQVEDELDLARHTAGQRLGRRDTFLFEEEAYLKQFAKVAAEGDYREARRIVEDRASSVWARAEARALTWLVAERALRLAETLQQTQIPTTGGLPALVAAYTDRLHRVDYLHRTLEHTVQDALGLTDELEPFLLHVRRQYRFHADALQKTFVQHVAEQGWPPEGTMRHTRVFDTYVAPLLQDRSRRVAFFMIDALRYEMAASLVTQLRDDFKVELHSAAAQWPTVTFVGMAALLPRADGKLHLSVEEGNAVTRIAEQRVAKAADRDAYFEALYGDRVAVLKLDDLFKSRRRKLSDTVQLVVVRTNEIDESGEARTLDLGRTVRAVHQKLIRSLNILQKELHVEQVIIATDHGFVLLSEETPGDAIPKPKGTWALVKDRCLIGTGTASTAGLRTFQPAEVDVATDADHIVVVDTLGTFVAGKTYLHSGVSLQECILPLISVQLGSAAKEKAGVMVQLQYKGGTTQAVTTRRPVIEVTVTRDMFGEETVELRIEALSGNTTVGVAASSAYTDPSSGLVRVKAGQKYKIPLRMEEEFSGSFIVKASHPVTQVTYGEPLALYTDYVD